MIERLHRQMKDALRARGAGVEWADHLPWVMLGLRAAPKEESGLSAGEAALGVKLAIPGQFVEPPDSTSGRPASHTVIPATRRLYADVAKGASALDSATWVYVKRGGQGRPLSANYDGPYEVLESGPKVFKLQLGAREEVVSRDRLKPHLGEGPLQAAQPPKRGRPPGKRTGGLVSGEQNQGE